MVAAFVLRRNQGQDNAQVRQGNAARPPASEPPASGSLVTGPHSAGDRAAREAAAPSRPAPEQARPQSTRRAVAAGRSGTARPRPRPTQWDMDSRSSGGLHRGRITRGGKLLDGAADAVDPAARPARSSPTRMRAPTPRRARGLHRFDVSRLQMVGKADGTRAPPPAQSAAGPGSGCLLVRFERGWTPPRSGASVGAMDAVGSTQRPA